MLNNELTVEKHIEKPTIPFTLTVQTSTSNEGKQFGTAFGSANYLKGVDNKKTYITLARQKFTNGKIVETTLIESDPKTYYQVGLKSWNHQMSYVSSTNIDYGNTMLGNMNYHEF